MQKEKSSVTLNNVSKIYINPKTKKEFFAVDNVNINIEPGEFVTLLGSSGCGKTTTLRMIAGFESPDNGEIYIGNIAVNELTPNKRDTAMVFQNYALLPHYNVFDNVAYGLKIRKIDKNTIKKKVEKILKLVGLEGMEARMINQLSGGQQQRVALARALVIEPAVLLFDEPLSNLDAKLRVVMRTEIKRIQREVGITAIYVTHDQSEAMAISDRIIIMNQGQIQQIGTPQDIYFHPKNHFVADFIGEANFLVATVKKNISSILTLDLGNVLIEVTSDLRFAKGEKCELLLRPESLSISDKGLLPCKVVLSTFMGSYQYYQVEYNNTVLKITDYNVKHKKTYNIGDNVYLVFNTEDIHILKV